MLRWIFLGIFTVVISLSLGWGQVSDPPQDDQNDPYDPIPPLGQPLTLGGLTGGGLNYHALVPKEGGAFEIANLGGLPASFLLVEESPNGQVAHQLEIGPGETKSIEAGFFEDDVLVVSLQPFRVHAAKPFEMGGVVGDTPPVASPTRPVRVTAVRMLDGSVRTVAIAPDNQVYYPVYIHRQPMGEWSPESKSLITKQGLVLEEIQER